jgi:hypothetical protein
MSQEHFGLFFIAQNAYMSQFDSRMLKQQKVLSVAKKREVYTSPFSCSSL